MIDNSDLGIKQSESASTRVNIKKLDLVLFAKLMTCHSLGLGGRKK